VIDTGCCDRIGRNLRARNFGLRHDRNAPAPGDNSAEPFV
jgi:hypothetical protein